MEEKIEKVHSYLEFLKTLGIKLLEDQANLDISASDTEDAIKANFQVIKKIILEELQNREKVLLDVVREFYVSESASIANRAHDVSKNVEILEDLVDLQGQHEKFNKTFEKYIDAVRNDCLNLSIQKSTRIIAQFDGKDKLITNCRHFGRISTGAPLKIIKILSQPGAILIKWDTIEKNLDIDEYCLQKLKLRSTSFTKKQKFEDCYVVSKM
ncbi:uncharacterized protein LOC108734285 isoform X2 [Agrilus planipennis]|uniref:Uncharacterized protein LOC108734285 isoform X2 n=1 Tax=Agrilus planipennis TaxID=224129 RepID=A0A7F5R1F4_AGRPL|nr:uncharacterized protein LOC108734285 isoform X2 [Agrilus planipennis]